MTKEQIEKAFEAVIGMPPRAADIEIMSIMGDGVEELAEYLWDHWMGEPEEPTYEQVEARIREVIAE